ncbi:MAG: tRNA pseudouridine(38-40) synthase TruA [Firmicutes bacterium HGW-Firmicutes-14]|nr:MAG: tRNA pseudouridine(38-40) synthase TruA [Firmicutes bacterium HGW-Firmicutes-14]
MRNIKVLIEYDGTNYHGFQKQGGGLPTIQQVLEEALETLLKHPVNVIGAGRTDAGVHARGQVINFVTECRIPVDRIALALNSLLPEDIIARETEEVDKSFHARFSALSKVYRYHIYNSRIPSAFHRNFSYHVPQKLDVEKIREAARYIVGIHDFSAFRAAGSKAKTSVRNVMKLEVDYKPPHLYLTIEADGFLYNMVRIITGTLLYVGKGKLSPEEVRIMVKSGCREEAGPTVPSQGLCMMEVKY